MKENINENINNFSQIILPKDLNESQNTIKNVSSEIANIGGIVTVVVATETIGEAVGGFIEGVGEVIGELFSGL